MTLSAEEFIRRFLLHVLPHGFHRIRYFGFLGNRYRQEKLAQCRQLLGMAPPVVPSEPSAVQDYRDRYETLTGKSLHQCPFCHRGHMILVQEIAAPNKLPAIKGHLMTNSTLARTRRLRGWVPPTLQGIPVPPCAESPLAMPIPPVNANSNGRKDIINAHLRRGHLFRKPISLSSAICQPFNAHRSSIVRRFSPIHF